MATPTLQELQDYLTKLGAARDAVDTADQTKTDADQAVKDAQAKAADAAQALPASQGVLATAKNDLITAIGAFVEPELGSTEPTGGPTATAAASSTPS